MHGPCRVGLCKDEPGEMCKKGFPKRYQNLTERVINTYPLYRRRPPADGLPCAHNRDNRYVVPYNAYLLLKHNAHINVEVIENFQAAIKYIFKYIFKGFDVASLRFAQDVNMIYDETKQYLNCRYVSPPEAIWRIFEFRMHDRSHAVIRLPIHLPNPTEIDFDDGLDIAPELEDTNAFFFKNQDTQQLDPNVDSPTMLYRDIPTKFVYNATQRRWNVRQQRGDRVVWPYSGCNSV